MHHWRFGKVDHVRLLFIVFCGDGNLPTDLLSRNVKALVGELDFSFRMVSVNSSVECLSLSAPFPERDKEDQISERLTTVSSIPSSHASQNPDRIKAC